MGDADCKKSKVAVIGCGNMGGAFAQALSSSDLFDVSVYDVCHQTADKAADGKKIKVLDSMTCASGYDVIIIAVKPQTLPELFVRLAGLKARLYVSICAGVTLDVLRKNLGTDNVTRFMPNIAAKIGYAVTAVAYSPVLGEAEKKISKDIALSVGSAFELEERLFRAFIGISGSGIAFIFEMMHQMAMGGVREGIPYKMSLDIVAKTMISAAKLQDSTQMCASELETMVCSAKGTTIEGVKALADGNFSSAVMNAVSEASKRSDELEKAL